MRVMLSGRVVMVNPPPRMALLILVCSDDLGPWLAKLSASVDAPCCCEFTLYQSSVKMNAYQIVNPLIPTLSSQDFQKQRTQHLGNIPDVSFVQALITILFCYCAQSVSQMRNYGAF